MNKYFIPFVAGSVVSVKGLSHIFQQKKKKTKKKKESFHKQDEALHMLWMPIQFY